MSKQVLGPCPKDDTERVKKLTEERNDRKKKAKEEEKRLEKEQKELEKKMKQLAVISEQSSFVFLIYVGYTQTNSSVCLPVFRICIYLLSSLLQSE